MIRWFDSKIAGGEAEQEFDAWLQDSSADLELSDEIDKEEERQKAEAMNDEIYGDIPGDTPQDRAARRKHYNNVMKEIADVKLPGKASESSSLTTSSSCEGLLMESEVYDASSEAGEFPVLQDAQRGVTENDNAGNLG